MSVLHTPLPVSEADKESIREQLGRLVASPLFRNSRRSPAFLRYVIEAALNGQTEYLKERTLGVEVFGRATDYDTSLDHIVRSTAGDVRRRLAQYYLEPEHATEIRIEIPPGSYVPNFRFPSTSPLVAEPAELVPPPAPILAEAAEPAQASRFGRKSIAAGATVLVLASLALWWAGSSVQTNRGLEHFWQPITQASAPASICIGSGKLTALASSLAGTGPAKPFPNETVTELHTSGLDMVPFSDAVALTRIASLLGAQHKAYRVLYEGQAQLADLRQGPVILIGAFDNAWTIRIAGLLRYTFTMEGPAFSYIRDRLHPADRSMSVRWDQPAANLTRDYAIVSRVFDPTTEQPVVIAGGITKFGTMAAGEFLTDARRLDDLDSRAPSGWQNRNIQILIATDVINGSSGPPRIVSTYLW